MEAGPVYHNRQLQISDHCVGLRNGDAAGLAQMVKS